MRFSPFFASAMCVGLLAIAGLASGYEDQEVLRLGTIVNESMTGMLPRAQDSIETNQEDRATLGDERVGGELVHAVESLAAKVDAALARSSKSSTTPHREQMDNVAALGKTPHRAQMDQVKPILIGDEVVPSVEPPRIIGADRKRSIDVWFDSEEYVHARELFETLRTETVAGNKLLSSPNGRIVAKEVLHGMKTFRPLFVVRPEEAQFAAWFKAKRGPREVAAEASQATTKKHRNEIMTVANAYYEFIDRLMNVVHGRHLPTSATADKPVKASAFIPFDVFYDDVAKQLEDELGEGNVFELYWALKNQYGNVLTQRYIFKGKTRSSQEDMAVWEALERAQFAHWFGTKIEPEHALHQALSVAESKEHRKIANEVIAAYKDFIKEQLGYVMETQKYLMVNYLAILAKAKK